MEFLPLLAPQTTRRQSEEYFPWQYENYKLYNIQGKMLGSIIGFILFVIILIIDVLTCSQNVIDNGRSGNTNYYGSSVDVLSDTDRKDRKDCTDKKDVKIFSFNIEYGAESFTTDIAAQIIKNTDADIIAIQEASTKPANIDASEEIAKKLGYFHVYFPVNDTAIISKYPIEKMDTNLACAVRIDTSMLCGNVNALSSMSSLSARAKKVVNEPIYFISAHFSDFPYQPNEVMNIPYCTDKSGKTVCQRPFTHDLEEHEIISHAYDARGRVVDNLLELASKLRKTSTVIIAGDFNEPSHLDWTSRAADAGIHPKEIRYPTSSKFAACGFIDTYRAAHPDEVREPGFTWPTQDPGYVYRADRIDFIYIGGPAIDCEKIKSSEIITTPSDHYAILSTVAFPMP